MATVEYKPGSSADGDPGDPADPDQVQIHSPAKNRYNGSTVGEDGEQAVVSKGNPLMFDRAARSWWNPKFDSAILEEQHRRLSFEQKRRLFQNALVYVMLSCLAWAIYFGVMQDESWVVFLAGAVVLLVVMVLVLVFTLLPLYQKVMLPTSVIVSILLCVFCLMNFAHVDSSISAVGTFVGTIEILIMIYTLIPMPLYVCVILGVIYSVLYEIMSGAMTSMNSLSYILGRALLHVAIHVIGIHIFITAEIRKRSTFLKVGQSVMSRRDLELENSIKTNRIHSLMPKQVAEEIMKKREEKERDEDDSRRRQDHRGPAPTAGQLKFRDFHMSQTDNTSILFADIVGFTKMSSNKTAELLVSLLSDLFGRFDVICQNSGCEKISTLGDCYYCVSGCPTPKPDHATCCVEMGLAMCVAIQEFDKEFNEEVNMRVGVHTGTVLCGLVGTRRFKFDVWSHDVTLANTMESDGKPGLVHISDSTYGFIKDDYIFELGEPVEDIRMNKVLIEDYDAEKQKYIIRHIQDKGELKTWFVMGRKDSPPEAGSPVSNSEAEAVRGSAVQINVEAPEGDSQIEPMVSDSQPGSRRVSESRRVSRPYLPVLTSQTDSGKIVLRESEEEPLLQIEPLVSDSQPGSRRVSESRRVSRPYLPVLTSQTDSGKIVLRESEEEPFLQPDTNGMSPALLPTKRDNLTASTEEIEGKETSQAEEESALMRRQAKKQKKEQVDNQLIECMNQQSNVRDYLFHPPINPCTLNFTDSRLERQYREHYVQDHHNEVAATMAQPRFSAMADLVASLIFYVLISVCCFLGFPVSPAWVVVCIIGLVFEIILFLPLLFDIVFSRHILPCVERFIGWIPRHVIGALLASLPPIAVYSNFSCVLFSELQEVKLFYCILLIGSLLHFCNFTMLSSWMKSSLATVAGLVLLILIAIGVCIPSYPTTDITTQLNTTMSTLAYVNLTDGSTPGSLIPEGTNPLRFEIYLNMLLLLILVWFLNREFEINYRLSFHGDYQATHDQLTMQAEKEQADWLLHNIIPEHVSQVLKETSRYCKNHKDVGVIFAKVCNFDDFYDESFEGGREYLRVLNELIGDFEDLFDEEKYKDVEKIKTIGSCLMAASGLNDNTRNMNKDPNAHLYALMDFACDMLAKLDQFNAEIFNFDFEMSIGFNFGPVTSGVIGTTKLLYDIWGDTVNISSRMYSTGVAGSIQVTEITADKLKDVFEFKYRDKIFVKGKGDMNTYLLTKKKDGVTWS